MYGLLLEKPRFARSASITLVAPEEQSEIRAYLPSYKGFVSWVPNPVESPAAANDRWAIPSGQPQIAFLGRFDVEHKGIDILVDLARRVPEADFHLYGREDARTKPELEELKRNATPNVFFHGPVFDEDKARVLNEATLYLQPSRWEAFGNSVAEAMCLGTPCAITSTMNMATLFKEQR